MSKIIVPLFVRYWTLRPTTTTADFLSLPLAQVIAVLRGGAR